jgi:hypothetical protein
MTRTGAFDILYHQLILADCLFKMIANKMEAHHKMFLSLITNNSANISRGCMPERSMIQSLSACFNGNDLLLPKMLTVVPAVGLKLRSFYAAVGVVPG